MTGRFQAGIGALIRRSDDQRYLLLRRAAHRDAGANTWECVTGRLEQGEGYETALHREVMEELGITVQIDFLAATSHFYRGAAIVENELLSVLYCCTIDNPDAIKVSDEHDEWRWVTPAEAYGFLESDNWLYRLLQRAEMIYSQLPDTLQDYFRANGYENT
jgi:8-oxo-dGTP diphosphatase